MVQSLGRVEGFGFGKGKGFRNRKGIRGVERSFVFQLGGPLSHSTTLFLFLYYSLAQS